MLKVDADGKVTISTGGVCSLGCKHCYTLTSQFVHQSRMTPAEALQQLKELTAPFTVICISGDTDSFENEEEGLELLECVCERYPDVDVMFTTRLIPSARVRERIQRLLSAQARRKRLVVPCISVISLQAENGIELPSRVPPGAQRIEWLNELAEIGIPSMLTLRPTFPFSLVSQDEVRAICEHTSPRVACALGEVFLIDEARSIERKLHTTLRSSSQQEGRMSFLEQKANWFKCLLPAEVDYTRAAYRAKGIPYFLRSMSGIQLLRRKWDFATGRLGALTETDYREATEIYP